MDGDSSLFERGVLDSVVEAVAKLELHTKLPFLEN